MFISRALNAVVEQALKANPSLDAAKAALRQAQENVYAGQGALYPPVSGTLSTQRQKFSGSSFGDPALSSTFSLQTAQLSVSYVFDIWGGTRRQIESLVAQTEFERFQLEAAYLSLTANVVTAAVTEASLRGQIAATKDIIDLETQELGVLQQQFELGGTSKVAVLAQAAPLAQTPATLPPLATQPAEERIVVADLAGRFPSQDLDATFDLATL